MLGWHGRIAPRFSRSAPTSSRTRPLTKSVWPEPPIWNASTHSPVAAPTQSVTINFAHAYGTISVFDPLSSTASQQTVANASKVTINVTDHPVIVQVTGSAHAAAVFAPAVKVAIGVAGAPGRMHSQNLLEPGRPLTRTSAIQVRQRA